MVTRMGSNVVDQTLGIDAVEGSEAIEIKIKTLDSQTYTLRVDKQVILIILFMCFPKYYGLLFYSLPFRENYLFLMCSLFFT